MTTTLRTQAPTPVVAAAGVVPWRRRGDRLQVALVHRPRYDDWSWPKGKLEPGEDWPAAAARETLEETGLQVRLGLPLPPAQYPLERRGAGPLTKHVRYWSGKVIGGSGALEHEIDEVAWLEVPEASRRLTHPRDREQLRAVVRADRDDMLDVWPLVIVRHARSVPRSAWKKADRLRPLNRRGRLRSEDMVEALLAYRVTRVVTSGSARCVDTVRPYAKAAGVRVLVRRGLSEEGFEAHPGKAVRQLTKLLERAEPSALCTHRPVLPDLLALLAERAPEGSAARRRLTKRSRSGMDKGELLVCHVTGSGGQARVVAVERHRPG